MDFLLRPVDAGMVRYTDLQSGQLTLEDILIMNVWLDNKAHNTEAIQKAARRD